jgi:hypothetical protein
MESNGFDELFGQAGEVFRALRTVYSDVTGEELDLESALKNYPLIVVGLAAGAGFFGGWLIGRRNPAALPPPTSTETLTGTGTGTGTGSPLDAIERFFPNQVGKVRDALPEGLADEAASVARKWVDGVLENGLKDASTSRFGSMLRDTFRRTEQSDDTTLDEPEE